MSGIGGGTLEVLEQLVVDTIGIVLLAFDQPFRVIFVVSLPSTEEEFASPLGRGRSRRGRDLTRKAKEGRNGLD